MHQLHQGGSAMFTTRGKTTLAGRLWTLEHRASRQGDPRLARACARGHRGLRHRRSAAVAVWRVGRRLGQGVPIARRGGFQRHAPEEVLLEARGGQGIRTASGRKAAVEVVDAVRATNRVRDVRSPFAPGNGGQISKDGRSAVVLFAMKGKADTAAERVAPVLRAVDGSPPATRSCASWSSGTRRPARPSTTP